MQLLIAETDKRHINRIISKCGIASPKLLVIRDGVVVVQAIHGGINGID